jgi:hypothetical protein
MLCAAAVLLPRFGSAVRLPDDVPVLVGQAYGQAVDAPHSWSAALDDARRRWMDDTMRRTEKAKNFQISETHTRRQGDPWMGIRQRGRSRRRIPGPRSGGRWRAEP